jgi:D-glycero-alpha-D-manno-heptose 1-phosphate guanylyltransferase
MTLPDIVILAGGKGTRLRSVVADLPKPMAPVAGSPFLYYLLQFLQAKGARRIILATGYMHQSIESYFGDRLGNLELVYSVENEPLGTGGAIKKAIGLCQSKQVMVYNGDTLFLENPASLVDFQKESTADISIFLKPMNHPDRYGTVEMDGNVITRFKEKDPDLSEGLINAGVYCFSSDLLSSIQPPIFSFEQEVLEPYAKLKKISGYISDAYFIDIGIPEDYEKANQTFGNLVY